MNQLIKTVQNDNGEIIVSGRELHEFLEVKTEYKKWFDRMTEYGFIENVDFAVIVKNVDDVSVFGGVRKITDHALKIDAAKEISMIQRNEKGKEARLYFIKVEKMWNNPEMIIKRAMDLQQKKIVELEIQIETDKQYTNFGKVVSNSNGAISIGAFAKMMFDKHNLKIGRNKMFDWLRENGYLIKQQGREFNNPKQIYVEQGLFDVKPTIVSRTDGDIEKLTTLITGKGQVKLADILLNDLKDVI